MPDVMKRHLMAAAAALSLAVTVLAAGPEDFFRALTIN